VCSRLAILPTTIVGLNFSLPEDLCHKHQAQCPEDLYIRGPH
jgi:hypothetical protein